MTASVRIALAGYGLVGRRHVDAIRQVQGVELCGIVEPAIAARDEASAAGFVCHASLSTLFKQAKPDGVILATPTPLHVEQALECVERGCPTLIEKPLATSAEAGRVLIEQADAAGVPLLVGHHRRHNPLIAKARDIIASDQIGNIRAVTATCWFYKPDHYFDEAPWRKQKGAGPISVNLVHDVDLIRHLVGEVVSVQAQAAPSSRGFENEEVAAAVLRFETGAVGTISVSDSVVSPWSWEHTSAEYPVYPVTSESCYLLGGTKGALSIPDLSVWSHGATPDWWSPISATRAPRASSDPLVNQIAHFADAIRGDAEPLVSGLEGLKTLRVVEAIQQSADTGETVMLT